GEVGEQHGRPQPQRDQPDEYVRPVEKLDRGDHAADLDHEHDRDVDHLAGIELAERLAGGTAQDRRLEQRSGRPGTDLGRPGLRRRCGGGWPGRAGLLAHAGLPGSSSVSAASSSRSASEAELAIMWSRTRTTRAAATKNATTVAMRMMSSMPACSEPVRLEHGDAQVDEHRDGDGEEHAFSDSHEPTRPFDHVSHGGYVRYACLSVMPRIQTVSMRFTPDSKRNSC